MESYNAILMDQKERIIELRQLTRTQLMSLEKNVIVVLKIKWKEIIILSNK